MLSLFLLIAAAPQGVPYHPTPKPLPAEVIEQALRNRYVEAAAPSILFVNFDGAVLTGGNCSSAPTNCSHIIMATSVQVPAFSGTTTQKQQVMDALRGYYADFNVQLVTSRPTAAHYSMIMIGGRSEPAGLPADVLGVGPLDCNELNPDDITFVFSDSPFLHNDPRQVAITAAQEAAHGYGLGHVNDMTDIMYPYLTGTELRFQNRSMRIPDNSDCTGTGLQNSYQLLAQNLGLSAPDIVPPQIGLTSPADGATVPNAFDVVFDASDDRGTLTVELWAGGAKLDEKTKAPWTFTIRAGVLPPGPTRIKGVARDRSANITMSSEITVTVKALGETPGDLGTSCTDSSQCNGDGYCYTTNGASYCTRDCSSSIVCPSGFTCTQTPQFQSVCTPAPKEDSGCSAAPLGRSREGGAAATLLALCLLALVVSRRYR